MIKRAGLLTAVLSASLICGVSVDAQTKKDPPKESPKGAEPAEKSEAALKAEETFRNICQACHLADGKGLTPDMSFTDGVWKHGTSVDAMAKVISEGAPGNPLMISFKDKLSKEEIIELAKIVRAFDPKLKGKK